RSGGAYTSGGDSAEGEEMECHAGGDEDEHDIDPDRDRGEDDGRRDAGPEEGDAPDLRADGCASLLVVRQIAAEDPVCMQPAVGRFGATRVAGRGEQEEDRRGHEGQDNPGDAERDEEAARGEVRGAAE